MRIAAGVLIIVVAVINLVASFGHMAAGKITSGVGEIGEAISTLDESSPAGGKLKEESQKVQRAGGVRMAYGVFLIMLCGLDIAAGVVLFRAKAAVFALVTGGLQVIAEGVSWYLTSFGVLNAVGVVVGVVVIAAAISYNKQGAAASVAKPA